MDKKITIEDIIEMSRKNIRLMQEQLQTLDKVFTAIQQHNRKANTHPSKEQTK